MVSLGDLLTICLSSNLEKVNHQISLEQTLPTTIFLILYNIASDSTYLKRGGVKSASPCVLGSCGLKGPKNEF